MGPLESYLASGVVMVLQVLLLNEHCSLTGQESLFNLTLPYQAAKEDPLCPWACKMERFRAFEARCVEARHPGHDLGLLVWWSYYHAPESSEEKPRVQHWQEPEPGWMHETAHETLELLTVLPDVVGDWVIMGFGETPESVRGNDGVILHPQV